MKYPKEYLDKIFDSHSPNYAGELDEAVMSREEFKKAVAALNTDVANVWKDQLIDKTVKDEELFVNKWKTVPYEVKVSDIEKWPSKND